MFIVKKTESSNKTIRMPNDLIEKLEKLAKEENISFNQLVVQCCEYAIDNLQFSNDLDEIQGTEEFVKRKKQHKDAFNKFLAIYYPDITDKDTAFSDAIYVTNHPELNIDFMDLLNGKISSEEYQNILELHFKEKALERGKPYPPSHPKDYVRAFTRLKEYLKHVNLI